MKSLATWLFATLQYPLPQHALSRLWLRLSRLQQPWLKDRLIRWFISRFAINLDEAANPNPTHYPHLNAFFTRALRPDARPLVAESDAVLSPVDAAISQIGSITGDTLLQAKGHHYTLEALLTEAEAAAPYRNGAFTTLYLSPRDYHRIHLPLAGRLRRMLHVPGRLFSVNAATTDHVPGLFARNERVICHFDCDHGPFAMVLVGAMLVGGIETVWHGEVTPPRGRRIGCWDYPEGPIFARGAEIGRFNMGSTVILLLPPGMARWQPALAPGGRVRMGEAIATLQSPIEPL